MPELIYQHPRLAAWLLDDHLIIANFPLRSLRLYNPSAAALWLLLIGGQRNRHELVNAYAELFKIPHQQAHADVMCCLSEWEDLDWLDETTVGTLRIDPRPESELPPETTLDNAKIPAHTVLLNGLFQLGDTVFSVVVAETRLTTPNPPASSELGIRLAAMLRGFPTADQAAVPRHQLRVVVSPDAVYLDEGAALCRKFEATEALGQIMLAVFRIAYSQQKMLGTLHAAAVGKHGALVLSGISGAGKSTLATHLASQGWSFYGDDIVGLNDVGQVLPFPAAASLKDGSWSVLSTSFPELAHLQTLSAGPKTVRYLPLASNSETDTAAHTVAAWIFPRYQAAAATHIEAMDSVSALEALIGAGFSLDGQHGWQGVGQFIGLLASAPSYRLVYSNLNEAQECLQRLLTP